MPAAATDEVLSAIPATSAQIRRDGACIDVLDNQRTAAESRGVRPSSDDQSRRELALAPSREVHKLEESE
jgi:hypothetical protein